MKLFQFVAGLLVAGTAVSVLAQEKYSSNTAVIGKVSTVYVRKAPRLLFERKLLRRSEGEELWAEVRFARASQVEHASELFRLPRDTNLERGDLVETRIAGPAYRNLNLLPEVSQVTKLVAKHDTLQAMLFGLPGPTAMWTAPTYATYDNPNSP